jgi:hypothetical protein
MPVLGDDCEESKDAFLQSSSEKEVFVFELVREQGTSHWLLTCKLPCGCRKLVKIEVEKGVARIDVPPSPEVSAFINRHFAEICYVLDFQSCQQIRFVLLDKA